MQPPDIITRKLHNLRVTISGYCATSGYRNQEVVQSPGYDTRKFSNQGRENYYDFIEFFQESFFKNNFQIWLPRGCATSGLLYPEIVQPLGIVTRKLHNLRVTIPKNCLKKNFLGKTQRNHSSFPFAWLDNFRVSKPGDCTFSGLHNIQIL